MINGIDVSKWQGNIDWTKVGQAGIQFAMIRASYGQSGVDSYFPNNAQEAVKNHIDTGAYHYCYAMTKEQAVLEAKHFLSVIQGFTLTYPIALDLEDSSLQSLSKQVLTDIAVAFLEEVEKAGYYAMLYANKYWMTTKLDTARLEKFDFWLAEYRQGSYTYSGPVGIWQHSNMGSVSGIKGYVDLDISYKDYPVIIRQAGLNHLEGGDTMTMDEALKIIQEKTGFDNNTMLYLQFYRYGESMIIRLAQAMQ